MSFENLDLNDELEEEPVPPEESSNRTFLIIAGVLGFIALLALVCIAVYALVLLPRTRNASNSQKATLDAANTQVAEMVASTSTEEALQAIIAAFTNTPTATEIPPTFTATSSPTPVVAIATTAVVLPTDTPNAQTATAMSLFATLDANATRLASTFTARPPQATTIPNTGFADDIGLPAMLGLAVLLIAIIFLARRLRTT
jgi:LPXTG-motif cell wall-anchored protein